MKKGKKEVIDPHGFSSLTPGATLTFLMSAKTLDLVDRAAGVCETDRARVLLATIFGEKIDPNSGIFIQTGIPKADDQSHPLTLVGEGDAFTITSAQNKMHFVPFSPFRKPSGLRFAYGYRLKNATDGRGLQ